MNDYLKTSQQEIQEQVAQKEQEYLVYKQRAANVTTSMAGRQDARGILKERAERLMREALGLDALLAALPMKLPPEADQALYDLVTQVRR